MKKYLFISFFLLLGIILHAQLQNVEYGLGSDYNFQSGGIGFEARGEIPVYRKFSITPRISYFPAFNSITEAYLGADIGYHFWEIKKIKFYGFLAGYYNMWINSADYDPAVARKNNLTFEGGLGTEYSAKCLIPFIESRVSSKWKESFLIIGLKICMANCKGRYKVISCPGFSQ